MTVRAKFTCQSMETFGHFSFRKYRFAPQYDTSIPEDQRFAKASPCGEMWMNVDNPAVSFEPGKSYYIDISEA